MHDSSWPHPRRLHGRVCPLQIKGLANGLDEYLLKTPDDMLLYDKARSIKRNILKNLRR